MDMSDTEDRFLLDGKLMKLIDKCYGFMSSTNPEIKWRILYIAINTGSLGYVT